jgi:iron complex transport system substrate-binding protein
LGAESKARQWLEALHRLSPPATTLLRWAAVYGFGGSTPGEGTLEDEVLQRAGFGNAATRLGIRSHGALSLEQLVISAPDLLVVLTYRETTPTLWQLAAHHPALERSGWQIVRLPSAWTTCPTPKLVAAVERLAATGRQLEPQ